MTYEELLLEDGNITPLTFKEYRVLSESFSNFLPSDTEKKTKHSKAVFDLVQKSYADQGGIKGSGFSSPEDMVKNIPMWKVAKHEETIHAVALYKDTQGRKRVAMASDGTPKGKSAAGEMMTADLRQKRAHMEISGKSLSFVKKLIDLKDHAHSFESAQAFHKSRGDEVTRPAEDDKEAVRHPDLKEHMYVRQIGGQSHTKIMLGHLGKAITESELPRTKEEEIANGKKSALTPGVHKFGNWNMDTQIHGPSQAHERQPKWTPEHWHDLLSRSHEALTNPSKHLSKPAKLTSDAVLVYSKRQQQGVVLRIAAKDKNNIKQGGSTRIETILPHKQSIAKEGTQRIVIEGIIYEEGKNLIIIE